MRINSKSMARDTLNQISKMISNSKPPGLIDINKILDMVDECIKNLTEAQEYMDQVEQYNNSLLEKMSKAQLQESGLKMSASENVALKNKAMKSLMEGYALVTKLREVVTGESIKYNIILGSNNTQVASATLNLEQMLSSANLDFGVTGIGLSIRTTEKQITNLMKRLNDPNSNLSKSYSKSVFQKMKNVQLNATDKQVWNNLMNMVDTDVRKHGINYGNAIESFMEYYRNKDIYVNQGIFKQNSKKSIYYNLLEKGRNNLAYYYGGDITYNQNGQLYSEQIKGMTSYTKRSRIDVATLSNVLTPLKMIRSTMENFAVFGPEVLEQQLKEQFTATEGQGDRPFQNEIKQSVESMLDGIFGPQGYSSG